MTRPEIEPRFPGPLANTLPLSQWAGKYITIHITTIYNKCKKQ